MRTLTNRDKMEIDMKMNRFEGFSSDQIDKLVRLFDGIPHKETRARFISEWMPFCLFLSTRPNPEMAAMMMVEVMGNALDCGQELVTFMSEGFSESEIEEAREASRQSKIEYDERHSYVQA